MRHIIMELFILFCIILFYFGFMIYIIVSHQSITSFLISCCFLLHRIVSCVVSVIFRENMLLWVGSSLMVLTMMHRAHDLTAVHCLYVLLMVTCRMILSEKIRNKSLTSWDSFSSIMILVLQHSSSLFFIRIFYAVSNGNCTTLESVKRKLLKYYKTI